MSKSRKRLDVLLYERNFADSREMAKKIIMAGQVYVNNEKVDKPGISYDEDVYVEVRGNKLPYVSRGGLKLEKAIKSFQVDLKGKIAMDIGASTGGFTDCMLQNGAKKVYSIDVGYGQLAWKLRNDERVVVLERTNFRYLTPEKIDDEVDFFSVDVSFISLKIILPVARNFLKLGSNAVCLIKPQFEAGREFVGKRGVVRDPKVHLEVINSISEFVIDHGFSILGLDFSPIRGPQGNVEYLIYLKKVESAQNLSICNVEDLVERANKI